MALCRGLDWANLQTLPFLVPPHPPPGPVPPQECNAAIHKKCIDKIIGRCTGTATNSRDTIVRLGQGPGELWGLGYVGGIWAVSPPFPVGLTLLPHFSWSFLGPPGFPIPGGALFGILLCMGLGGSLELGEGLELTCGP